ncbi:hypothetical protein CI109_100264 [Kwoniella shandongensis]|uniref:Uncharacterized protein n=1 Tax=Kwoniella shandongensis TaxID=1734106 RepID=A0A5M6C5A7_9TREE|nr:uncharacterized protein CI109_001891 [Kwoniella shandongensis]KAA5529951.1 hypothetical protein CI109_001891 [Kwoniella shandongensis]
MPKIAKQDKLAPKPYDRSSSTLEESKQPTLNFAPVKYTSGRVAGPKTKGKKGEYDKQMLVALVLKSANDIKWDDLAFRIGKTSVQGKDVWRKVIHPALITNRPWNVSGKGWTGEMKLQTLMTVLEATNPDWQSMTSAFPGKSKSQIHDVWRKIIFPRLKRGETIE